MTDSDSNRVALAESLDFSAATELASELRGLRQEPVTIDASDVGHLGAPGLQVLLSASRTWHEDSIPFSVENHSSAFSEGLARMGIVASELSHPGDRS